MQIDRNSLAQVHQLIRSVGRQFIVSPLYPSGRTSTEPLRIKANIELWAEGMIPGTVEYTGDGVYRMSVNEQTYVLLYTADGQPIPLHRR